MMTVVRVKVTAGAKKERFELSDKGYFIVVVKEEAERNAANGRVKELIAAHFGVPFVAVRIITGHRSVSKTISVGNKN